MVQVNKTTVLYLKPLVKEQKFRQRRKNLGSRRKDKAFPGLSKSFILPTLKMAALGSETFIRLRTEKTMAKWYIYGYSMECQSRSLVYPALDKSIAMIEYPEPGRLR